MMMKHIMAIGLLMMAMASVLVANGAGGDKNSTAREVNVTPASKVIHGQVFYPDRIAIPPQALLTVQLVDMTATQPAGKIMAQIQTPLENQMPIPLTLPMTEADLDVDHIYALQARITVGDVLWFANERPLTISFEREGHLIRLERVGMATIMSKSGIAKPALKKREWRAERIDGAAAIDPYPSLLIEDIDEESFGASTRYRAVGTGSCNRYFSTAVLDEEKKQLQFSPLGMTFMACVDSLMHQENRFANMMSRVRSYQLEKGDRLVFLDEDGEIIARFSAQF